MPPAYTVRQPGGKNPVGTQIDNLGRVVGDQVGGNWVPRLNLDVLAQAGQPPTTANTLPGVDASNDPLVNIINAGLKAQQSFLTESDIQRQMQQSQQQAQLGNRGLAGSPAGDALMRRWQMGYNRQEGQGLADINSSVLQNLASTATSLYSTDKAADANVRVAAISDIAQQMQALAQLYQAGGIELDENGKIPGLDELWARYNELVHGGMSTGGGAGQYFSQGAVGSSSMGSGSGGLGKYSAPLGGGRSGMNQASLAQLYPNAPDDIASLMAQRIRLQDAIARVQPGQNSPRAAYNQNKIAVDINPQIMEAARQEWKKQNATGMLGFREPTLLDLQGILQKWNQIKV